MKCYERDLSEIIDVNSNTLGGHDHLLPREVFVSNLQKICAAYSVRGINNPDLSIDTLIVYTPLYANYPRNASDQQKSQIFRMVGSDKISNDDCIVAGLLSASPLIKGYQILVMEPDNAAPYVLGIVPARNKNRLCAILKGDISLLNDDRFKKLLEGTLADELSGKRCEDKKDGN